MARRDRPDPEKEGGREPPQQSPSRWEISADWPFPTAGDIARRFDELIGRRWRAGSGEPPADVFVLEKEIVVEMDLPGVEEGGVVLRVEGETLWIEATRRIAPPAEAARPARLERSHGPIRRQVALPRAVAHARVEHSLERGVLRVRVRAPNDEGGA
jgi:HSP20 family molecular chaperone IbpA